MRGMISKCCISTRIDDAAESVPALNNVGVNTREVGEKNFFSLLLRNDKGWMMR